MAIDKI